jgi:4-amino-4-deoxy-L-arabinose transferase-like glycosyltransferase
MNAPPKSAKPPAEAGEAKPVEAKPAGPPRFLSWLARRSYAVLALLCLLLWTPGLVSLPALDRDESRFAESSKQMLDSGNIVDIRFGQVPRYKKPVGIYWMQAAATAIAGPIFNRSGGNHTHIWTYRLPSLLGGIASVWLTVWIAAPLFGAEAGFVAGLLMAMSILLTAEATIATTDAVLLASVLGMQGVLLRLYHGAISRRLALWGWAALALGILVKGPVAPAVAAITVIVLGAWQWRAQRWQAFAWLKGAEPLKGALLLAALVLPWLIAIALASHGAFFSESLGGDFAAKVAGGQESHGAPPGYFLVTSIIAFWPSILFVLPGIGLAWTRRGEPAIRFLLAWAGSWWLLVEAVPTKLPHYVLPAYPALAMLAALWLLAPKTAPAAASPAAAPEEDPKGKGAPNKDVKGHKDTKKEEEAAPPPPAPKRDWSGVLLWIAIAQFAIGLAAMAAAPVVLARLYGADQTALVMGVPVATALISGASLVALIGLIALIMAACGIRLALLIPLVMAVCVATPLLTALTGPRLDQFWISSRLGTTVAKDRIAGDPPPVLAGYEEPSLVFALGADTGLSDGKGAAEMGARQGGLALIEDGERPQFLARLAELQADATALDDVSGFNYSRGKRVHVTVYRVTALESVTRPLP